MCIKILVNEGRKCPPLYYKLLFWHPKAKFMSSELYMKISWAAIGC